MTRMLASVRDLVEARLVAESGADIIDLKNPAAGARLRQDRIFPRR